MNSVFLQYKKIKKEKEIGTEFFYFGLVIATFTKFEFLLILYDYICVRNVISIPFFACGVDIKIDIDCFHAKFQRKRKRTK